MDRKSKPPLIDGHRALGLLGIFSVTSMLCGLGFEIEVLMHIGALGAVGCALLYGQLNPSRRGSRYNPEAGSSDGGSGDCGGGDGD